MKNRVNTVYIDPLIDFAFKKIFGSEPNKDLLIAFLNELFRGRKHIVDLIYIKNEYPGEIDDIGGVIFDLICTDQDGSIFLIEVQRSNQQTLKERMVFYSGRLISDMAPKGHRSRWNYNLKELYVIVLIDDFVLPDSDPDHFLNRIKLCNEDTGAVFYHKLGFIYIELLKFVKREADLETDLDRWLYVLKNMAEMKKIPAYLRKPIFEKLFNIAEYTNLTKEEKEMYDVALKRKWDEYSIMTTKVAEGREEGLKEGMEKGRQEGREEGREEIVLNAYKNGFTLDQLQAITNWGKGKIMKILKKNNLL